MSQERLRQASGYLLSVGLPLFSGCGFHVAGLISVAYGWGKVLTLFTRFSHFWFKDTGT